MLRLFPSFLRSIFFRSVPSLTEDLSDEYEETLSRADSGPFLPSRLSDPSNYENLFLVLLPSFDIILSIIKKSYY